MCNILALNSIQRLHATLGFVLPISLLADDLTRIANETLLMNRADCCLLDKFLSAFCFFQNGKLWNLVVRPYPTSEPLYFHRRGNIESPIFLLHLQH